MIPRILLSAFIVTFIAITFPSCDDEPHIRELPGKWTWESTCGGFSGQCTYPDEANYKSLEFTGDRFIERTNGAVSTDTSYKIVRMEALDANMPYQVHYELELGDGSTLVLTLWKNHGRMTMPHPGGFMFSDNYKAGWR